MKRSKLYVLLFVLLAVLWFVVIPASVMAQDVTPEVTDVVITLPTLAPTAAVETPVPPEQPPVIVIPQPDLLPITGVQLAAYIVLAFAAGGGALAILYRVLENKDVQDTVEKLYESWSPETQEFIKTMLDDAKETTTRLWTFMDRVTDGLPNTAQAAPLSHEQVKAIVRSELQNVRDPTAYSAN